MLLEIELGPLLPQWHSTIGWLTSLLIFAAIPVGIFMLGWFLGRRNRR